MKIYKYAKIENGEKRTREIQRFVSSEEHKKLIDDGFFLNCVRSDGVPCDICTIEDAI